MEKPKISIVTVSYNSSKTIEETIRSVLYQSYRNIEYVIVDGDSNDGTKEILEKYGDKIKWISEPDNGIYDAMNKSLSLATGDFILFLGSDDHLLSESTIENVVSYITDFECVYYGNVFRSCRNDLYKGKFNKYKLSLENICHQSIFYPKSVYKNVKYETKYRVYADYYYNLTLFPKVKYIYLPLTVCYYNYEGFSSNNRDIEFERDVNKYVYKQNGLFAISLRLLYLLYKRLR